MTLSIFGGTAALAAALVCILLNGYQGTERRLDNVNQVHKQVKLDLMSTLIPLVDLLSKTGKYGHMLNSSRKLRRALSSKICINKLLKMMTMGR